jgi:hypothetical protein
MGRDLCRPQDLKPIAIADPRTHGGMPVMQVRRSGRVPASFSTRRLSLEISPIFCGPLSTSTHGWRTYGPSAMNAQEIEIYVALPEGVYRFEAGPHWLSPGLAVTGAPKPESTLTWRTRPEPHPCRRLPQRMPEAAAGFASHRPERLPVLRVGRAWNHVPRFTRPRGFGEGAPPAAQPAHPVLPGPPVTRSSSFRNARRCRPPRP